MARHKGLTFYEKKKRFSREIVREIFITIFYCFAAALVAFVFLFAAGMKVTMIGVSMEPTLHNGQEVLINRFVYKIMSPKRGDVIAFLPNGNPNSHHYLKRVVGLPGERVQIIGGYLYIDGEPLEEGEGYDKIIDAGIAENEILLANDEYFVSEDSRSGNIGPISKNMITGRAWFRFGAGRESMGLIK